MIVFPKPTGQYAVGTKAFELHDDSRTLFHNSNPKRWMVQAYYPMENAPSGVTYPYMPGTLNNGMVEERSVLAHAQPDAAPILHRQFPVIFLVPGMGEERQKYTILCEELASQGYVVLSLDQPYFSNYVKFPDGTTLVMSFKDIWRIRDRDYRYAYYDEAMAESIQDITYMMDHLEEIGAKNLGGIFDKNRLILMGHSFGGNVANALGFKDSRIKAVVDIDSKITERAIFGHIGVPPNPQGKPVLFIRGMMQYQEDLGDQTSTIRNASVWLPHVQHSAFSDQAYLAARIPGFGNHGMMYRFFHWFFKRGPHFDKVGTNLDGKDADAWFAEYRAHIVNWLKNVLQDNLYDQQDRSPIGDDNVQVYFFISDRLLKERSYSKEQVSALINQEKHIQESHSTDKPLAADIFEGEMANLLRVLCRDFSGCQQITLYQREGVGIADSGLQKPLEFKDEKDSVLTLGFLGINPVDALGTHKRTTVDGRIYDDIVKAILYDIERHYAYLSTERPLKGQKLIGYVRYMTPNYTGVK
jgi:dienelactone hydrolase